MKTKIVFHFALVVVLVTFATGCCTRNLVEFSNKETVDRFFPDSTYKSTNGFAFGGNLHKQRLVTPYMPEAVYVVAGVLFISLSLTGHHY